MKRSILVILTIFFLVRIPAQTVCFINNSSDPANDTLRVWLLLDGFINHQPAIVGHIVSPGMDFPPNTFSVGFSLPSATNFSQCIQQTTVAIGNFENALVIINGISSGSGYSPGNTISPTSMSIHKINLLSSVPAGKLNAYFYNGVTDAPVLEIGVRGNSKASTPYNEGKSNLVNKKTSYIIDIEGSSFIGGYSYKPLDSDTSDRTVHLLTNGFADPSTNSNGQMFRLFHIPDSWNWAKEDQLLTELQQIDYVGLKEKTDPDTKTISISPNPHSSHFNINVGGHSSIISYTLKDIHGKVLKEGIYQEMSDPVKVNTEALPAGIYILETEVDSKIITVKTVKL